MLRWFTFSDPPGKPNIDFSHMKINVHERIRITCAFEEEETGNPDIYEYKFYSTDGWTSEWINADATRNITNVNQNGPYTCQARNKPNGTKVNGEVSESALFEIYGMFIFCFNKYKGFY